MKRNEELPPSTKPFGGMKLDEGYELVAPPPGRFPPVKGLEPETKKKAIEAVKLSISLSFGHYQGNPHIQVKSS